MREVDGAGGRGAELNPGGLVWPKPPEGWGLEERGVTEGGAYVEEVRFYRVRSWRWECLGEHSWAHDEEVVF